MTRSGFSPRLATVALAALLAAFCNPVLVEASDATADPAMHGSLRMHTLAVYPDGRQELSTLRYTGTDERPWESLRAEDWVTVGSRVTNTSSWRSKSKVNYGTTELARQNPGKRLMKKGAALVNRNRGTPNAPTHKIKNTRHDIVPRDQFPDFASYILQFHFDGRNTVIMDEANEFVNNVPPAFGQPPDADLFAIRYEFATVQNVLAPADPNAAINRWEGTYWIEEADIYVRDDVFDRLPTFNLNVLLVFGYLTNSGYEPTGWSDDALGFVNPHAATEEAFNNRNSDMWKQHQERDRFYYENVKRASTNVAMRLLPLPHTVIDIGGNTVWYQDSRPPLGQGPVFIQSAPSAFNGNKKAVTKIFRIDPGPPERLRRITTLRNNLENWPRTDQGIPEPWFPLVRYNSIRFAKQRNLDQVAKAIADHCVAMTIRSIDFSCVLPVRVRHQAYTGENGGKETLNVDYYLIDSYALRQAQ